MPKPAAMFGSYVGAKFMSSFKVMRISVDIPQQDCNDFLKMFGAPDAANPVPVFIARRADAKPAEPLPSGAPAPERSEPAPKRASTRSQIAFLKCQDPVFQKWIGAVSENDAKLRLCDECCIDSRSLLDDPANATAIDLFEKMLASFDAETKWGMK